MMKVIGLVASPRRSGNTAWVVNKILEGAAEYEIKTDTWYFSELDMKPCNGCFGCKRGDRRCVINDDMQKLYAAIEEADALVLGSPVYMGQMTAQAKIFTDRLFAQFSPRFSPFYRETEKKKLILVFTQGNPDSELFKVYFDYTREMFEVLEFDIKGVHVIAGMRNEPAEERAELHSYMKDIGVILASEL